MFDMGGSKFMRWWVFFYNLVIISLRGMGESLTLHRHWIEDRSDLVYIICSSAAFFHHSMVSQTGAGVSTALAYLIHINEFGDTFLRRSTSACDLVMVWWLLLEEQHSCATSYGVYPSSVANKHRSLPTGADERSCVALRYCHQSASQSQLW